MNVRNGKCIRHLAWKSLQASRARNLIAIAAIVAELAATVLKNRRSIFSVTSLLDDYYGIGNVAISVPSFVGDEGVAGKLMYDFTQDEMENLHNTATKIRAFMDTLGI